MIYGLLVFLFVLVIGLYILVLKYRSDVNFFKDMCKINNDYVKECKESWYEAIGLCRKVCEFNEELLNRDRKSEDI